jgi:hypothetical protein
MLEKKKTLDEMTQDEIDEMCERDMARLAAELQSEYEPEPGEWPFTKDEEEEMCKRYRADQLRRTAAELRRMADELDEYADELAGKPVPADAPHPMPYPLTPYDAVR